MINVICIDCPTIKCFLCFKWFIQSTKIRAMVIEQKTNSNSQENVIVEKSTVAITSAYQKLCKKRYRKKYIKLGS